ncbi:hypothetical protein C8R43DRAFT_860697, partial [Mycena crocata]
CLNLPDTIRNKPENMYTSILTGPHEPKLEQLNGYFIPLIDQAVLAWNRGIHISSTGGSP